VYVLSSNDELVDLFQNQIKTEETIVDSVKNGLAEIKNPAVKGVLKAISLDSVKHAEMYSSAITLLTELPQTLTEENLEKLLPLLETEEGKKLYHDLVAKYNSYKQYAKCRISN